MPLVIENEETAIDALRRALDGQLTIEEVGVVDFRGWPTVSIHLPGTPIDSSITPSMMEAFIELQRSIYRAHMLVTADNADLRALSKAERETLEFRVRVSEGSSDYAAELAEAVEKIGVEALAKMPPELILAAVLGVALILGGTLCYKAWLSARIEQRKLEVDDADKQRWLEAQKAALDAGIAHNQILARAIERVPVLADVEAFTESARASLAKSIGDEGGGTYNGLHIEPELASEISTQKRQQGETVHLAGLYRVDRLDTNAPDGFRVTLSDVRSGENVTAMLQDALLSEDHKAVIQSAEWNKVPFFAEITARKVRNRLVDATVILARKREDVEAGE